MSIYGLRLGRVADRLNEIGDKVDMGSTGFDGLPLEPSFSDPHKMVPVSLVVPLSADAGNERTRPELAGLCDAYLIKPFSFDELFDCFATLVPLTWIYAGEGTAEAELQPNFASEELPEPNKLKQLRTLGETGFVRSIEAMLNDIEASSPRTARFCRHMRFLVTNYRLRDFLAVLEEVKNV